VYVGVAYVIYMENELDSTINDIKLFEKLLHDGNMDRAIELYLNKHNDEGFWDSDKRSKETIINQFIIKITTHSSYPTDQKFKYAVVLAFIDTNQYEKAYSLAKELTNTYPKNYEYWYKLADVEYVLVKYHDSSLHYERSIQLGSPYIWAYLRAAECKQKIKQNKKAEQLFRAAISKKPDYYYAHYLFADFLFEIGKYKDALSEYKVTLKYGSDDKYILEKCTEKIELVSEIKYLQKKSEFIKIIDKILSILKYDNEEVTHYTGIDALNNIVFNGSPFRLSEASYLNDPSEGTVIYDIIRKLSNNKLPDFHEENSNMNKEYVFFKKPFVGSFVEGHLSNSLTLWRMYGKDKDREATGASIVLDRKILLKQVEQAIQENINKNKSMPNHEDINSFSGLSDYFSFYRVIYVSEGGIIADRNNHVLAKQIHTELKLLSQLSKSTDIDDFFLRDQLNRIACLFKLNEYAEESEVRIVIPPTGLEPIIDQNYNPPKVYIQIGDIKNAIRKITIGPKAENKDQIAAAYFYHFSNVDSSISVHISNISYR
jgi:tetratricopeptide (TPR) repeat protein